MYKRRFGAIALILALLSMLLGEAVSDPAQRTLPCGHPYTSGNVSNVISAHREASCTERGGDYGYCRLCGTIVWDEFVSPALGHNWGKWTTLVEVTCTTSGQRARTCARCGAQDIVKLGAPGHDVSEMTCIQEMTDRTKGIWEGRCARCGKVVREEKYPEGTLLPGKNNGNDPDAVKDLQEKLNARGCNCGKPDGIYGKKTISAVKKFQKERGLEQDGIAWPVVLVMLEGNGLYLEAKLTGSAEAYAPGDPASFEWTLTNTGEEDLTYITGTGDVAGVDQYEFYAGGATVLTAGSSIKGTWTCTLSDEAVAFCLDAGADEVPVRMYAAGSRTAQNETVNTHAAEFALPLDMQAKVLPMSPPAAPSLEVTKEVVSLIPNGIYYEEDDEIEYLITVKNTGGYTLGPVTVSDPLKGEGKDAVVGMIDSIEPDEEVMLSFTYTVTDKDTGSGIVINRASADWSCPDTGDTGTSLSAVVTVPASEDTNKVRIEKDVANKPKNGSFFTPDEVIVYKLTVTNPTEKAIKQVVISDPMKGEDEDAVVLSQDLLASGASVTGTFAYTVTDKDAYDGVVVNEARVEWAGPSGKEIEFSGELSVKCGYPGDYSITLTKTCTSYPADGVSYKEGEKVKFDITIEIEGDVLLDDCSIADVLERDENSSQPKVIWNGGSMAGGTLLTVPYEYTVTKEDADKGILQNEAILTCVNSETSEEYAVCSNLCTVLTGDTGGKKKTQEEPKLVVTKTADPPADGIAYREDEYITFRIQVENASGRDVEGVSVTDIMNGDLLPEIDSGLKIPDGGKAACQYVYRVTAKNVNDKQITNVACVEYTDPDTGKAYSFQSGTLVLPTADDEPEKELSVVKKVLGEKPYYTEGEKVVYLITFVNPDGKAFTSVDICDILCEEEGHVAFSIGATAAKQIDRIFTYTVTATDVESGMVTNGAWVEAVDGNGEKITVIGEGKTVKTRPDGGSSITTHTPGPKRPVPDPQPPAASRDDVCTRTLTAIGADGAQYTLHFCKEHASLAAETEKECAGDVTPAQLDDVTSRWMEAIDEMYAAWKEDATEEERSVIDRDRNAFFSQLTAYRRVLERRGDPEAARVIAGMLENKCADLCFAMGSRDRKRADSVFAKPAAPYGEAAGACGAEKAWDGENAVYRVTGCADHESELTLYYSAVRGSAASKRVDAWKGVQDVLLSSLNSLYDRLYLEADEEGKKEIVRDRKAFGNMVDARMQALTLLWPDDAETVMELAAQTILVRLLDVCRLLGRR